MANVTDFTQAIPAAFARRIQRSHRRARRKHPWLQGIAIGLILPLLSLASRVRIHGREHLPAEGGFILAPNHPSILDPFFVVIPVLGRRIHFMGKGELWRRALPAWLMSRLGGFPVRRGTWDEDAFATAATVLERGRLLVMFPEGGVSPAEGYKPARPGIGHLAHVTGATVVPVHLEGTRRLRHRPWTWPRITVRIGPPIAVEHDPEPSRERAQVTAQRVLEAIKALGAGPA